MTKALAVLFFMSSCICFAGGSTCRVDGTNDTVKSFTADGVNFSLVYEQKSGSVNFPNATVSYKRINSFITSVIAGSSGTESGVLSLQMSPDQSTSSGFFTKIWAGSTTIMSVSCTEAE